MHKRMPRLLIAGFGFLGQSLRDCFTAKGWAVDGMNRSGSHEAISCDLSDPKSVNSLSGGYDAVIHCAATGGGGKDAYQKVYYDGARNLLHRFPQCRFLFISSTSVYPQIDHSKVTEKSLAEPQSETAQVLRQTEKAVIDLGGSVLRLSALCGPERMFLLKSYLNGSLDSSVSGKNGERVMNYIHRDDASSACALLIDHWQQAQGEIWNASAFSLSRKKGYELLSQHIERPAGTIHTQSQARPAKRAITSKHVDSDKLRQLGWQPRYTDLLSLVRACG